MIKTIASLRRQDMAATGYLFGYQSARLDQFLTGGITQRELADDVAVIELLRTLNSRCSTVELDEIAAGTRELPGEDVHSGG